MGQRFRDREFDESDISDFESRLARRTKELEWNQEAASQLKEIAASETDEQRILREQKLLREQREQQEKENSQSELLQKFPGLTIPVDGVEVKSPADLKSSVTEEQEQQNESIDALDVDALVDEVSAEDAELARLAAESQKEIHSDPELANRILLANIEEEGISQLKARVPRDPAKNPAWNLLNLKTVKVSAKDLGLEQSIIDIHNRDKYRASQCTIEQNLEVYNNLMISINTQRHLARSRFTTLLDQIGKSTDAEKKALYKNIDFTVDSKEKKERLKAKRAARAAQGGKTSGNGEVKPKSGFGPRAQEQLLKVIGVGKGQASMFKMIRSSMKSEGTWTFEHDAWAVRMGLAKQGE